LDHRWVNNHKVVTLTKTPKTSYPTHYLGLTPFRPLNDPPSTMHKQGVAKMFDRENTSLTQTQKHQKLENNYPK
jgi:hypothetical protein